MFTVLLRDAESTGLLITRDEFTFRADEWTQVNFPDTETGRETAKIYIMEMIKLQYIVVCQLDLGE